MFISVGSTSLSLGSGVFSGSGSGARLAADPVIPYHLLLVSLVASHLSFHLLLGSVRRITSQGSCCWT